MKFTFEHRTAPFDQQHEVLLKEYELAQDEFYAIERTIWTSANIFILLSLGGVTLLATLPQHDLASLVLVGTVGVTSLVVLWVWYGALVRWSATEQVMAYRMEEIEDEVGMWKMRYVSYLDRTRLAPRGRAAAPARAGRLARLDRSIPHYPRVRLAQRFKLLFVVLVLGWVVIITREIMLVAGLMGTP